LLRPGWPAPAIDVQAHQRFAAAADVIFYNVSAIDAGNRCACIQVTLRKFLVRKLVKCIRIRTVTVRKDEFFDVIGCKPGGDCLDVLARQPLTQKS
jgi:hypothetical protein